MFFSHINFANIFFIPYVRATILRQVFLGASKMKRLYGLPSSNRKFLCLTDKYLEFLRGESLPAMWESLITKRKLPRTLMLTSVLLLLCVGHLMIAFPFSGSLYIAMVILGFAAGAQMTLIFTFISEFFGLKYYATLVNCGLLASPILGHMY